MVDFDGEALPHSPIPFLSSGQAGTQKRNQNPPAAGSKVKVAAQKLTFDGSLARPAATRKNAFHFR